MLRELLGVEYLGFSPSDLHEVGWDRSLSLVTDRVGEWKDMASHHYPGIRCTGDPLLRTAWKERAGSMGAREDVSNEGCTVVKPDMELAGVWVRAVKGMRSNPLDDHRGRVGGEGGLAAGTGWDMGERSCSSPSGWDVEIAQALMEQLSC